MKNWSKYIFEPIKGLGDIIRDYNHGDNEYGMTFSSVIICIFLNIIVSGTIGTLCALVFTMVSKTVGDAVINIYDKYTTSHDCHICYRTCIQEDGWQKYSYDGDESGTKGQSLSIEAMLIYLDFIDERFNGNVVYQSYMQKNGWDAGWTENGDICGIEDGDRRMEAFRVRIEGEVSNYYDVYYRAYVQKYGWLAWTSNGGDAGTAGYGLRLECIMIKLVKKEEEPPENIIHKIPFLINSRG